MDLYEGIQAPAEMIYEEGLMGHRLWMKVVAMVEGLEDVAEDVHFCCSDAYVIRASNDNSLC